MHLHVLTYSTLFWAVKNFCLLHTGNRMVIMSTCTFSKWNTDHDLIIKIFLSSRKEYTLSTPGGYSADRAKYGAKIKPPPQKNPLDLQTKPKKILGPKINHPKNPLPNFRALKISRKH